ncbi:unnamed protein product [Lactuca saligna]|uniref:Uncharacterized protein n=1 Tax=Lactuca saligna TaxID=75948 RepID=A0AA35Z3L0_LACSI|nr:unnamed protein product [Lactuca saligna]
MVININFGEQIITLLLEKTSVTPPWVPTFDSNMEEGRISNIPEKISIMDSNVMDSNVNMGDGSSTSANETTNVPLPPPSSPPQTSTLLPTSVLVVSPTFQGVMNVGF